MEHEPKRLQDRVPCPTANTPVQLAPMGTTGTFDVRAFDNNTDKIGFGGEPDAYVGDDERTTDGPLVGATTQNVPLYDAGYGRYVTGDLGLWWVAARVAGEGVCWFRVT